MGVEHVNPCNVLRVSGYSRSSLIILFRLQEGMGFETEGKETGLQEVMKHGGSIIYHSDWAMEKIKLVPT